MPESRGRTFPMPDIFEDVPFNPEPFRELGRKVAMEREQKVFDTLVVRPADLPSATALLRATTLADDPDANLTPIPQHEQRLIAAYRGNRERNVSGIFKWKFDGTDELFVPQEGWTPRLIVDPNDVSEDAPKQNKPSHVDELLKQGVDRP